MIANNLILMVCILIYILIACSFYAFTKPMYPNQEMLVVLSSLLWPIIVGLVVLIVLLLMIVGVVSAIGLCLSTLYDIIVWLVTPKKKNNED